MIRSTGFIILALAVAVGGWLLYSYFSAQAGSEDVVAKGAGDALLSPQLAALISLITSLIGMFSGLAGLAIKLIDLRSKSKSG